MRLARTSTGVARPSAVQLSPSTRNAWPAASLRKSAAEPSCHLPGGTSCAAFLPINSARARPCGAQALGDIVGHRQQTFAAAEGDDRPGDFDVDDRSVLLAMTPKTGVTDAAL